MHQQNLLFSNILKQNNRPNTHSLYIGLNLHGGNVSELQLEGGEDPKDYHVTLLWGMFTPRSDMDDTVCRIQSVMDEIQSQIPKRMVFYHERRFEASKSSDGKDVIVAAVAGGELITVHNKLVKILKKEKIKVEENFEYNPHMTLAYIDPEAEHELRVLDHSAEVKDITVCIKRLDTNEKEYEREFQMAKSFSELIEKFNPYHDSKGRFATSNGAASFTYKPGASTAHTKAIEREKAKAEAETGKGFKGTLYHGSPNTDIEEFDMSRAGQNTSSGEKLLFFTDSKQMADDFSYERLEGSSKFFQQRGEKSRVYEVDVEMKNPLDFRNLSDKDIDNILKLDEEGLLTKQEVQRYAQSNHQLLKAGLLLTSDSLKELGYDGLIANTGKAGHNSLEYAVVDSKQAKIIKSYEVTNMENNETLSNSSFQITKADDDKRLVFGWALVSATKDGSEIIDHQDDIVEQDELEEAAYEYVLNFRDSGEEHMPGLRKKARMVESVVFTEEKLQAMGIPFGTVPIGWWVGFYVDDDEAWEKIKNGTYRMFSIEGRAVREPVDNPVTKSHDEEGERKHMAKSFSDIVKFNPYHDSKGRFTSASGGGAVATSNRVLNFDTYRTIKDDDNFMSSPTKTFSYNNERCHAHIVPGVTKEDLTGIERHVGELDGYDIYQIPDIGPKFFGRNGVSFATFDQHGFIGIKKSAESNDTANESLAKTFNEILKFNPYHDSLGRFATSSGYASFTFRTKDPKKQHMADMAVAREKEKANAAASAKPKDENAFTPAKDKAEAMDYAKNKLGIGYADYGKLDIDTINHINQEITEIQKKYPELKEAVSNIAPDNRNGVYAAAGTGYSGKNTLYIGQAHYSRGIEHLKKNYQADVTTGFHPANTDYKSIIWHEYGHILAYQHYKTNMGFKVKDSFGYYDGMEYAKKVRGRSYEKAVLRDAAKSMKITQKELKSRISKYAEKNPAETFAEAFAEFNNSPNPRPECIAMMKAAGIFK